MIKQNNNSKVLQLPVEGRSLPDLSPQAFSTHNELAQGKSHFLETNGNKKYTLHTPGTQVNLNK